jgi:formyl-CoA transferase
VRDHEAVVADPAAWENGYFATVEGPEGPTRVVAAPVRFSETPAQPSGVAPELGQHTEEVLIELDFSWDEIGALKDAGIV